MCMGWQLHRLHVALRYFKIAVERLKVLEAELQARADAFLANVNQNKLRTVLDRMCTFAELLRLTPKEVGQKQLSICSQYAIIEIENEKSCESIPMPKMYTYQISSPLGLKFNEQIAVFEQKCLLGIPARRCMTMTSSGSQDALVKTFVCIL